MLCLKPTTNQTNNRLSWPLGSSFFALVSSLCASGALFAVSCALSAVFFVLLQSALLRQGLLPLAPLHHALPGSLQPSVPFPLLPGAAALQQLVLGLVVLRPGRGGHEEQHAALLVVWQPAAKLLLRLSCIATVSSGAGSQSTVNHTFVVQLLFSVWPSSRALRSLGALVGPWFSLRAQHVGVLPAGTTCHGCPNIVRGFTNLCLLLRLQPGSLLCLTLFGFRYVALQPLSHLSLFTGAQGCNGGFSSHFPDGCCLGEHLLCMSPAFHRLISTPR